MVSIFDTHAHYNDPQFLQPDSDEQNRVLGKVFGNSPVRYIVNAGTNPVTNLESIALAEKYDGIYAACGIHPEDCAAYSDFDGILSTFAEQLKHPKVVAIGEIGLDYHWEPRDEAHQKKWMRCQLELADKTGYPVIIHDREAHGNTMDLLREFPGVTGILHSFSGSAEMAKELVRHGWYISFSGVITFKNASKILDAVRIVPDDRILVETDCPYLAPVPMRGKRNDSSNIIYTAQKAAEVRGVSYETFCEKTMENACRVYRMKHIGHTEGM